MTDIPIDTPVDKLPTFKIISKETLDTMSVDQYKNHLLDAPDWLQNKRVLSVDKHTRGGKAVI